MFIELLVLKVDSEWFATWVMVLVVSGDGDGVGGRRAI